MSYKNLREESRKEFGTDSDVPFAIDQIQLGAILRIADALEKIAKSYPFDKLYRLEKDLERSEKQRINLERSIRSYRGAITRMKK